MTDSLLLLHINKIIILVVYFKHIKFIVLAFLKVYTIISQLHSRVKYNKIFLVNGTLLDVYTSLTVLSMILCYFH